MLTAAKALSYENMKDLLRNQKQLLPGNSFISIVPEDVRQEDTDVCWPQNSDRWLSMFFDDIRPEHLPLLPVLEEYYGRQLLLFGEQHADQIIKFLKQCHSRPQVETLYVNCMAGISRSGAIASFACETFNLDRKQFLKDNPQILPNNLVLYLLRERWPLNNNGSDPSAGQS
jgi:predicted protein tyrosine phosphatase